MNVRERNHNQYDPNTFMNIDVYQEDASAMMFCLVIYNIIVSLEHKTVVTDPQIKQENI